MRRFAALLLTLCLCTACAFADGTQFADMTTEELIAMRDAADREILVRQEDPLIEQAIAALLDDWETQYAKGMGDGYVGIRWTRVVYLTEEAGTYSSMFENRVAFVEFVVISDFFGTAPYYMHAGVHECVAFYADGSVEVMGTNPINNYRARTYTTDFTGIIDRVSDRGGEFNGDYYVPIP